MSVVETMHGPSAWTAVDLVTRFGPIPLDRVRYDPAPGTATEADLLRIHDREDRLYELVDGTLVEKVMGAYESYLASNISTNINNFVDDRGLGIVLGEAGMMRFAAGLVRIPDVSFISTQRMRAVDLTAQAIPDLIPDLAVEVISPSNTPQEMESKLHEYFAKGVRLVWYVYPKTREVHVYHSPTDVSTIAEAGSLSGENVIPGFSFALKSIFKI